MTIQIKNLSFVYNPKAPFKKTALSDVSLTINDGDFFGIIGHTGSGKSTLISHLNGLIKIQSGSIIVDGIDLTKKYNHKQLRSRVGMVFQYPESQLFDTTVAKDVGFGPSNLKLDPMEIEKRVKEAIGLVGLDYESIKDRSPFEISGGQMRRVALAGVLAMKPKILILDEPTAGLDPQGKKQILSLINALKKDISIIIMISHNMDEIFENCNRIALMSASKLIADFSPSKLKDYADLIEQNGLAVPSVFRLTKQLNQKGYDLSAGDEAGLVKQIVLSGKQKK